MLYQTKKPGCRLAVLTSQQPSGSPLAASNPADIMVISGPNSEAAIKQYHISKWL